MARAESLFYGRVLTTSGVWPGWSTNRILINLINYTQIKIKLDFLKTEHVTSYLMRTVMYIMLYSTPRPQSQHFLCGITVFSRLHQDPVKQENTGDRHKCIWLNLSWMCVCVCRTFCLSLSLHFFAFCQDTQSQTQKAWKDFNFSLVIKAPIDCSSLADHHWSSTADKTAAISSACHVLTLRVLQGRPKSLRCVSFEWFNKKRL